MTAAAMNTSRSPDQGFYHQALLYAGMEDFVHATSEFIRAGLDGGEPTLVVVDAAKIELLRSELGDPAGVLFADMRDVGANPARIIPAWHEFVSASAAPGRRLRGIGEPIGPDRGPAELTECQHHESLLNLAFADTPAFWLLCPYDTEALDPAVIGEAMRSHPFVAMGGQHCNSASYAGLRAAAAPFSVPLPQPAGQTREFSFGAASLGAIRHLAWQQAESTGLVEERRTDLSLAVGEIAANSVMHGGGQGSMRMWEEGDTLLCEISDPGRMDQPLAGRERPRPGALGGYGLWLANQLCDLVQVRSHETGTVVRLHMHRY